MPISIGDAVLVFSADTTQLDAAYTRINAGAKANLSGAQVEAQKLAQGLNTAGAEAIIAGEGVVQFGQDATVAAEDTAVLGTELQATAIKATEMGASMKAAGEETAFSMKEAKGEIALLGEATGITLPRHVRGFLAELPGVGAALNAAFSATAVFFLIEALVEGTKKLTEFISETFIFTESMKEADKITLAMNAELQKNSDATKKLKDDYSLLGLEGVAKTGEQMRLLQRDLESNNKALEDARQKVRDLNSEFSDQSGHEKEFAEADKDLQEANANRVRLEQQRTNLAREAGIQRQADAKAAALAEIEIEKQRAASISSLKLAENQALAADQHAGDATLLQTEAQHQLEMYQIDLEALRRKEALLKTDKTGDPNEAKAVAAQIEQIQRDHAAALIEIYANVVRGINSLSLGETGRADIGSKILGADFKDKFGEAEDAAKSLGITLSGTLAENVDIAREAVVKLEDAAGHDAASAFDVLRAKLSQTQAEISFARSVGNSTEALTRQERELRRQLGLLPLYGHTARTVATEIGQAITSSAFAFGQSAITIGQAMRQIAGSIISAIASIAEKKGIEQLAEAFGSWPDAAGMAHHFAAAALWFTLAGAVSAGAGAAAGSGNNNATSSGGAVAPQAPSAAQAPGQQPVQTINVQSLAGGGLISRKSLMVLGDSASGGNQREVVLPLGQDDNAMNEIAGRIVERMPGGGGVVNNFHFKGSLIDHSRLLREQTRMMKRGQGRLTVSNSYRVTRRG